MDNNDEHFFEALAGAKTSADEAYEVELVKSDMGTLAPPVTHTKSVRVKTEPAKEIAWSDGEPEGQLTVDVYQTSSEIVVESAIAGVTPDEIDVNVTSDSISIHGSRKREKNVKDEDYLYQECYWGKFARTIILPQEIDPEGAEVTFKNGILTIHLPKANKKKSRKLKVQVS